MKFLINQSLLLVIILIAFTLVPINIVASEHATNRANISAVAMQKVNEAQTSGSSQIGNEQEVATGSDTAMSKQHKERPSGGFLALILLLIFIFVSTPILFIIWLSARRNK
ncbi:hypothetical protein [Piscirickettsia salmonis]|uniref:hypothetical protein n=1 Tax=Piscirickettsia salmonis TaxID=1238 RepID=UPI0007C8F535|nr:hypothetical protein A0O36_00890 [Piscirickettsiaceae bacterium NZ-RLO1]